MQMKSHFSTKKYSKKYIIVLLLAVMISFTACIDPYSIRAARTSVHNFRESKWMSVEPVLYLEVDKTGRAFGYVLYGSGKIEVEYAVDWGRTITIWKKPLNTSVGVDDYILEGVCKCTEEQIIITVQHDYMFNWKYETITMTRIEPPEVTKSVSP